MKSDWTKARVPDALIKPTLPAGGKLRFSARLALGAVTGLVALPVIALIAISVTGDFSAWPHLLAFVLPRTFLDTVFLLILVGLGTTVLGAGTAWLTTVCRFPGHRIFTWALVLPLAVPSYIAAYTQLEFFDFSGPIQGWIRAVGGYQSGREYWFPDLRSLGGAALVFSTVLYPYVYMTTRLVFARQGATALDASRSLGAKPWRMFREIGFPMARPAVAAGVALVLMETLNDIGAVEILGVKTITYAVFETWLNRDSLSGAVQLALVSLAVIIVLLVIERRARGNRGYASGSRDRPPSRLHLRGWQAVVAFSFCTLPILIGLGVPLYILGIYALRRLDTGLDGTVLQAAFNSIQVSALSGIIATCLAFAILQYGRISRRKVAGRIGRLMSLGYAVPGTVLAIGLLVPLAGLDNLIDGLMRDWFGISTGLLISGTVAILVYAYVLRFVAISHGTLDTAYSRMSPHVDYAARSLGRTPLQVTTQIHIPLLRTAVATSFLLVFVDSMKELSATLLLRPFDFETLATFVYDRASQSALEDASWAALAIVLIGLLPVYWLSRTVQHVQKKHL
ncbi:MAG: iron ABC transporter permease [Pseudomonadota bacterium]